MEVLLVSGDGVVVGGCLADFVDCLVVLVNFKLCIIIISLLGRNGTIKLQYIQELKHSHGTRQI